jgi:hypothetical protein
MKNLFLSLTILIAFLAGCSSQKNIPSSNTSKDEQQIIQISKDKWQWMSDKDIDKLEPLFHDKSKFVHMSGTWKKNEELEIIKSGSIWYKKADIHDVAVEMVDDLAMVWSRITLTAVVRGSDAVTEFTVTEVYKREKENWKMTAMTFSSVRDTHKIQK